MKKKLSPIVIRPRTIVLPPEAWKLSKKDMKKLEKKVKKWVKKKASKKGNKFGRMFLR